LSHLNYIAKLENCLDEDIFDIVEKLEKSFGLKFEKDAFCNVETFGDLCDIFTSKAQGENFGDCTSQQAFYKIRNAIAETQLIDKNSIKPESELQYIFPRDKRIQKIRELQRQLGLPIDILAIKSSMGWTIFACIMASLVLFYIKWEFALVSLLFSIVFGWVVNKFFSKELDLKTVRQLTEKLVSENYIKIRRKRGTINKQEVLRLVIDTFSNDLAIDKAYLTRTDKFNWETKKSLQ
jgi:hypothetical protein